MRAREIIREEFNQTGRMKLSPYQQEDGSVYNLVLPVDDFMVTVDELPRKFVNPKTLLATQIWIDPIHEGGDEVVPGWNDYPFIVQTNDGQLHILDGHHRVDHAIENEQDKIEVYFVPVDR